MDNLFPENGFYRKATDRHDERVTVLERSESHPRMRLFRNYFVLFVCWELCNSVGHGVKPSDAHNPESVCGFTRYLGFLFRGFLCVPFMFYSISNLSVAF